VADRDPRAPVLIRCRCVSEWMATSRPRPNAPVVRRIHLHVAPHLVWVDCPPIGGNPRRRGTRGERVVKEHGGGEVVYLSQEHRPHEQRVGSGCSDGRCRGESDPCAVPTRGTGPGCVRRRTRSRTARSPSPRRSRGPLFARPCAAVIGRRPERSGRRRMSLGRFLILSLAKTTTDG
jgi:hypothetical protein